MCFFIKPFRFQMSVLEKVLIIRAKKKRDSLSRMQKPGEDQTNDQRSQQRFGFERNQDRDSYTVQQAALSLLS